LLDMPERPTAVFCSDDTMACAAMDVCREHGLRVPEDISFVGAGNTSDGEFACTPLTTVDVPRQQIGSLATENLIRLIMGQGAVAPDTVLPVGILVRSSTAPLNRAA
jgi:LacI family transcriptional regulator